ncbi:MAG: hypothetical protein ACRD0Z_10195 [Acidimicrobiales bacterium]
MSAADMPSPVIEHFVRKLGEDLPDVEEEKLSGYTDQIAKTTAHGDLHRAWHCATWAIQLAERPAGSHLGHLVEDIRATHKLWEDTVLGAGFAVMTREGQQLSKEGIGTSEDVEIQWVDSALAVAAAEAGRSGWEAVPWEALLTEMLAVGSSAG